MEKVSRRRQIKPIARKRHNFFFLLLGVLFAISTVYIFLTFPPDYNLQLSNVAIPIFPVFIISFLLFLFSLITFIFIQKIHGILVSLFIFFYFLLRLFGLTHWIFAVLLFALFVTLEFFIRKQK